MSELIQNSPPSKINKTALIYFWFLFVCFFLPLDLESVDPRTLPSSADLGLPHDHVSATHWRRKCFDTMIIRWPTPLP